jgi:S1-C subfamily serine protease
VKITATACGLGVEGSGWFAGPNTIVTAAHVVAGAKGIEVDGVSAQVLVLDKRQDVAVLHRSFLGTERPLRLADPQAGDPVAILGYPENGPFDARPGRIGSTADVLVQGRLREVTALSGLVRHGNSGGPAVNERGEVEAMVFAARIGARGGYGIPASPIRADLARAKRPVSTGSC